MSAQPDPPPWTGPWGDDARRLFQLLQAAVEQAAVPPPAGAPAYEHPPECRYCPFCQGVTLLRRAGPEALDQLSEFAAGLAATLRATQPDPASSRAEPPGDGEAAAAAPGDAFDGSATGRTSAPSRPPSTVRIDVTD